MSEGEGPTPSSTPIGWLGEGPTPSSTPIGWLGEAV